MDKWMCRHLGRSMAGIIGAFLLVSFLMPLTSQPAQAQGGGSPYEKLGAGDENTLPRLVVVDFGNSSKFSTGAIGEELSNKLMFELTATRLYDVVKKSEMVNVGAQMLNPPVPISAVSVICAQLKANYGVNGNIEKVTINESAEGTYAEVTTSYSLISRILRNPIAGGRIVQKSAPRKDYHGSNVEMVSQAVSLTAYSISNSIINTRFQVANVLASPSNGTVTINLGSVAGMREGMRLTTLRFETVTGTIEIVSADSFTSVARVVEGGNNGIAIGDKAIPIFSLDHPVSKGGGAAGFGKLLSRNLPPVLGAAGLYYLISSGLNQNNPANSGKVTAFPVADATKMPSGEIRINCPTSSSNVIAHLLYRDSNPNAPIALVQPGISWFEDRGGPLAEDPTKPMRSTSYTVSLDTVTGSAPVIPVSTNLTDPITSAGDPMMTIQNSSFAVTTRFVPMNPGDSASYFIRTLSYNIDTSIPVSSGGLPTYKLVLSNSSDYTQRCVMLAPPTLQSPSNGSVPLDGVYRTNIVPGATSYKLQISTDSSFSNNSTILSLVGIRSTNYVQATVTQAELSSFFGTSAGNLYWRYGSRADGFALPKAINNPNWNGYVYCDPYMHQLSATPRQIRSPGGLLSAGQAIPKGSSGSYIMQAGNDNILLRRSK